MNNISKIEALLDSYCTDKVAQATAIDQRYSQLWSEIGRYLAAGGKRMRPRLVLLAYDAYKTSEELDIMPIAAAWELLHACLLVHDDIIDRDTMRHGQPNIAGRYQTIYGEGAEHYALSAALLSGDLLLMATYEMVNTADISSDAKLLVHSYFNEAFFAVGGGELIDTDAVLYPIPQSNPRSVATHKTASYSLQLPLQCGAALAGASSDELEKLSAIGLHLGIAYQLRDDLLGVFGDSQATGKSNRSDILEKKRTALIHATLAGLDSTEANELTELFAPDHIVDGSEAEEIVGLIIKSGAKEIIKQEIEAESIKALEVIDTLAVNSQHKEVFTGIVSKLTTRKS